MPTYDFKCDDCDQRLAIVQRMNDERPRICPVCEGELRRVIQKPMIAPDIAPYVSIATGEVVSGRKAHREHLVANQLTEVGDQMSKRQRDYMETDPFEQRRKWYKEKGKEPPTDLREQVEAENV